MSFDHLRASKAPYDALSRLNRMAVMTALRSHPRTLAVPVPAPPRRLRHGRLWLVTAIASALAILAVPSPAAAHTELISSTPAEGTRLKEAPGTISLEFSGAVDPAFAAIVVSVDGGTPSRLDVEAGASSSIMVATVPPADTATSGAAKWRVDYRVTSVDGHPILGKFTFSVGAVPSSQESSTVPKPDEEVRPSSTAPPAAVDPTGTGTGRWVYVAAPLAFAVLVLPAVLVLFRRRRDGRDVSTTGNP